MPDMGVSRVQEDAELYALQVPIEKLYCSRCGKCMTMREGVSTVGCDISYAVGETPADEAFTRKQFGKYFGTDHYRFCMECFLNAMFQRKRNKRETQ